MIFVIFFVFFGSIIAFDRLTRKYVNPFQLILIFGKKGSGKSTYLTRIGYKYLKKGWTVYTNMLDCNLPGIRLINADQIGDFVPEPESVLLIDEAGMLYDARDFKRFKASTRDFYKYQRHYRCIVYLASQSFDVDKKLRDLTDLMYLQVVKFRVFSVGKRIDRYITLTDPTGEEDSRIADSLKFAPFTRWTWTLIPHWSRYFDSHVIPVKPYIRYRTPKINEKNISLSEEAPAGAGVNESVVNAFEYDPDAVQRSQSVFHRFRGGQPPLRLLAGRLFSRFLPHFIADRKNTFKSK